MLNILYDGSIFAQQPRGGVSRYFANLAEGMFALEGLTASVVAPIHINAYLRQQPAAMGIYVLPVFGASRVCQLGTKLLSPVMSRTISHDLVHETYYSQDPVFRSAAPRVTTIHDMIHEIFALSAEATQCKKSSISRCAHIICVSESTRRDLCEIYDVTPSRVSTVYHGYQDFGVYDYDDSAHSFAGDPFFLYVGLRSGYKNFEAVLRAFATQSVLERETRILCFGGGRFSKLEKQLIHSFGLKHDRVLQLQGPDRVLASAYRQAIALVYPSICEGFGFPPLEAMSVSCPVVCSNTSSLPEVVGAAALSFDPRSYEAIGDAMVRVLGDGVLRQELIRLGHQQREKFSWKRCCEETARVYRNLI